MPTKKDDGSMKLPRAAGVLLHPTSLPNRYGVGDLGASANQFIDFLAASGQSFWQVLPIGPTGYADSPYQNISAFAGNPLLIDIDALVPLGLVTHEFIQTTYKKYESVLTANPRKACYDDTFAFKSIIFTEAFSNFEKLPQLTKSPSPSPLIASFHSFCDAEKEWLDDFALFYSIKKAYGLKAWKDWPSQYVLKDPAALDAWKKDHARDLLFIKFLQWLFQEQWQKLRMYAHMKGIQIIGDMPIFVAHDSSDVWSQPELFTLKPDGTLEFQAGVPPDYFSKTGQLWGNPLYNWNYFKKTKFKWFIRRFKRLLALLDWIRVDHFRGFEAYWEVKGGETTAINGRWVKAPGKSLFLTVRKSLGKIPIIAEDLGVITPEVEKLRDYFKFPGMRVLQFAFGGDRTNPHLPHNYVHNSIVYTGTHDNDTTAGWWAKASKQELEFFTKYTGIKDPLMPDELIKIAYQSIANLAIVPMQDVLGQGSESRMNTPSVPEGNWQFRLTADAFSDISSKKIKALAELYSRNRKA